ncbi:MAG: hypothetical protein QMB37_06400 [Paludibacteraceae bacterium]
MRTFIHYVDFFSVKKTIGLLFFALIAWAGNIQGQTSATFTSNGTFTPPAGVTGVTVELWGGGGGGGGCNGGSGFIIPIGRGGGGAGGAFVRGYTAVSTNVSVNVGAGGAGGSGNENGTTGGSSTFLTLSASGGTGGSRGDQEDGAGGGITTGIPYNGGAGSSGSSILGSGAGGGGAGNGGSGGNASGGTGGTGGAGTITGGNGAAGRTSNNDGVAATALSAGGGGGFAQQAFGTNKSGGAGYRGQVIVYYYQFTGVSATSAAVGSASTVTISATTTNLPVGTYTVTYNLTGANTATGNTATLTVSTAGTGTFSTSTLANTGSTTVTITNITNGTYAGGIGANNTATFNVTSQVTSTMAVNTVSAASVCAGTTKVPIQSFTIAQSGGNANLTGLSFTTSGTYAAADISNFKLWTNTSNNLSGATQVGSSITSGLGVGSHSFATFSQALTSGATRYFWITMDVVTNPASGGNLAVSALSTSSFTVSTGIKAGSSTAGGTQTINTPPSITTQPSTASQTLCAGSTATALSVTASGTAPLSYQWYSNLTASNSGGSPISGATSSSYTPLTTSAGTLYYYCVVTGQCTPTATSNVSGSVTVNATNTWVGGTSTAWSLPANWSCGIVPVAASNVVIPTGLTNYPVVNIPNAVCNNLSIADGASLTVNPGQLLTVGGSITGAESAADAGKIRVKASPDGTGPNGSLIINCTANTGNTVFGTVEFYTKGNKATTAVTWYDNIDGSPTKGTTFNANYQWQFFGVPVKEIVANPTFYGSFLRKYREDMNSTTTAKWEVLNNTSKLEAFEGYEITQAAAKMIEIAGELQFCDKTLTLTRIAPVATNGIRFGLGQNIFGNSYTAAIKISEMTIPATVDQTVYLYNTGSLADWGAANLDESPFNSPMTAGSYISIPKQVSNTIWDDQIPSMQGFLLKYTTSETVYNNNAAQNAQVTLKYANGGVVGNTKPQLAPKAAEEPLSYLRVNLQSKSTTDNLWLFSREGTSSSFDNGWDGRKHFGTPTAFVYSMTPDGPMQVNTDRTIDGSVINFYANSDTDYTLTLVKSNLDAYSDLKLIDFGTKTVTPLTAEMTRYNFTSANAGVVEKRFMIVNSASKIDFKKNDFSLLYGYLNADKTLIVTNFSGEPGTMTLSTASGVIVMNKPLTTGTSHFPTSLRAGAYILTMQAGTSRASIKVLVNNK